LRAFAVLSGPPDIFCGPTDDGFGGKKKLEGREEKKKADV